MGIVAQESNATGARDASARSEGASLEPRQNDRKETESLKAPIHETSIVANTSNEKVRYLIDAFDDKATMLPKSLCASTSGDDATCEHLRARIKGSLDDAAE